MNSIALELVHVYALVGVSQLCQVLAFSLYVLCSYIHLSAYLLSIFLGTIQKAKASRKCSTYCIARKFDGELNLVVWWSGLKPPN